MYLSVRQTGNGERVSGSSSIPVACQNRCDLSALSGDGTIEPGEALPQFCELLFRQVLSASGYHAPGTIDKFRAKFGILGGARDVKKRPHQPQAYCRIGNSIVSDLLESRIKQAIEANPRYDDPQYPGTAAARG